MQNISFYPSTAPLHPLSPEEVCRCKFCSNINVDLLDLSMLIPVRKPGWENCGYKQHANFYDLISSAAEKCDLCLKISGFVIRHLGPGIYQKYMAFLDYQIRFGIEPKPFKDPHEQDGSKFVVFILGDIPGYRDPYLVIAKFHIFVERGTPEAEAGFISGRPVYADSASNECFDLVKQWISRCDESHGICKNTLNSFDDMKISDTTLESMNAKQSTFMPSRIIDVGRQDGSQEPVLRTQPGMKPGLWVALSHRWGGISPLATNKATLDERKTAIPLHTFPKTFRDAVIITRKLGLRYLWIDSLCIVQDDVEDWKREASQMGNVYQHSYLTIAAAAAKNCESGIHMIRGSDFSPLRFDFSSTTKGIAGTFYLRAPMKSWNDAVESGEDENGLSDMLRSAYRSQIDGSCLGGNAAIAYQSLMDREDRFVGNTLNSRAWVLQESILSPRTLHFASEQAFWECKTLTSSESDVSPVPMNFGANDHQWQWEAKKRFLDLSEAYLEASNDINHAVNPATVNQEGRTILYMRWYTTVAHYSKRNLTVVTDKLPALSGVAEKFQAKLADSYTAGLFAGDMHRGLLWGRRNSGHLEKNNQYLAPSWSWISVNGAVEISLCGYRNRPAGSYAAEISEVKVVVSEDNPYGEVSSGSIKLRGRWRDASVWTYTGIDHIALLLADFSDAVVRAARLQMPMYASQFNDPVESLGSAWCSFDVDHEIQKKYRAENRANWGILQLAVWQSSIAADRGTLYGLILEEVPRSMGVYRRIGLAHITTADGPTENELMMYRNGLERHDIPHINYKEAAGASGDDWEWRTVTIV